MKRIIMIALFLSVVFQQDFIWQDLFAPQDKIMAPLQSSRTQLGDNYYYYILAKKAVLKLQTSLLPPADESIKQQSFFYENSGLENIYSGALLIAGLIDQVAQHIPVDWNFQLALSFMLQLSLLLAGLLTAYTVLRGETISKISLSELAMYGFLWVFFCRGVLSGIYTGDPILPFFFPAINYYPDVLRIVSPQVSWGFGMFYIALVIGWFQNPTRSKYMGLILLSLCIGCISVAVMLTLAFGLGLYGLVYLLKNKKIHFPLLGIGLALLVSLLYARHQFGHFYLTEKGMSLQTGQFIKLHIALPCLVMLVFLPWVMKFLPENVQLPLGCLYVASLLLGAIAESFELGDRLWLRGAGAFVWFLLLYTLFAWARSIINSRWSKYVSGRYFNIAVCMALFAWAVVALNIQFSGWYNYIEKDKAEVISWLRARATLSDVVASADLEDAYFIPIYTTTQPYVQLRDYSSHVENEVLEHYFEILDLVGLKQRYVANILSYTNEMHDNLMHQIKLRPDPRIPYEHYQTYAFFGAVLYYPFTVTTKNIFASDKEHQEFKEKILRISNNSFSKNIGKIDYIIFKKNGGMKIPPGFEVRFDNASYQILSHNSDARWVVKRYQN